MKKKLLSLLSLLVLLSLCACTTKKSTETPPEPEILPLESELRQQPAGGLTLRCGNDTSLFYSAVLTDDSQNYSEIWQWDHAAGKKQRIASQSPLTTALTEDTFFYTVGDTLYWVDLADGTSHSVMFCPEDHKDAIMRQEILLIQEDKVYLLCQKITQQGTVLQKNIPVYCVDLSSQKAKKVATLPGKEDQPVFCSFDGSRYYVSTNTEMSVCGQDGKVEQTYPLDLAPSYYLGSEQKPFLFEGNFYYVNADYQLIRSPSDFSSKEVLLTVGKPEEIGYVQLVGDTLYFTCSAGERNTPLQRYHLPSGKHETLSVAVGLGPFVCTQHGVYHFPEESVGGYWNDETQQTVTNDLRMLVPSPAA